MRIQGNNMVRVKKANKQAVLNLLLYEGGLSRKKLASKLQLTPSAITILVNEMITDHILEEAKVIDGEKTAGRKEIMVDIDERYFYALGISINLDEIMISATTLKGRLLWQQARPFESGKTAQALVEYTLNWLNEEVKTQRMDISMAVGLGVTVRGWIDSESGISIDSFGLWDEKNIPLKEMFKEKISLPVFIENNVRGLANAQMFLSGDGSQESILFIRGSIGIGSAFIIRKQLYTGYMHNAMELGHIMVEADGELCRCGRQGCLETVASNRSVERHALSMYDERVTPILYKMTQGNIQNMTLPVILQAAEKGDKTIRVYVDRALNKLAGVMRTAFYILDPQSVVLYGQAFENPYYYQTLYQNIFFDDSFSHLKTNMRKSEFNMELERCCAPLIAIKRFFDSGLKT